MSEEQAMDISCLEGDIDRLTDQRKILVNLYSNAEKNLKAKTLECDRLRATHGAIKDPDGKYWWPERIVGGNGHKPWVDGWISPRPDWWISSPLADALRVEIERKEQ